ncbi:MAG: spheroidene monooxygenase, partial [Candidatus Planktophila sp.]
MNKVVVAYFWKIEKKSLPFAFFSMAGDRRKLRNARGVHFAKMLGTGTGEKFTPSDADLSRWGALIVIDENILDLIDSNPVIKGWNTRATNEVRMVLDPIAAHGLWSGSNPFDWSHTPAADAQVVAITRARIKWRQNFRFWSAVPPVSTQLHKSPGLIAAIGIGEAPIGLQGTFSLWENGKALRDFAYKGSAHQGA